MRNARGKLFDERAVAGLDGFGGDRQGAANVVDDRQPGAFKRRDRGVIAPRIEANRAGQDRDEAVVVPKPDVAVEQVGQHSRRHMGIDMRV